MRLLLKFNGLLLLTLGIGMVAAGVASDRWLEVDARRQVDAQAQLLIEAASAVRDYTSEHIKPKLKTESDGRFNEESVPAFAAKTIFKYLRNREPSLQKYSYKESANNPTNRDDIASEFEAGLIREFQAELDLALSRGGTPSTPSDAARVVASLPAKRGVRATEDVEPLYYYARPLVVTDEKCLDCHDTPERAEAAGYPEMVKLYGRDNGFRWKLNQVVAAQVVRVPMQTVNDIRSRASWGLMGSMGTVVGLTFLLLNLALVIFVTRPVSRLSEMAVEISRGNLKIGELPVRGHDEVSMLTASFNRMYRSLVKAIRLLKET